MTASLPCSAFSASKVFITHLNGSVSNTCVNVPLWPRNVKHDQRTKAGMWSVIDSITVHTFPNMSHFADEKNDSQILCLLDSKTDSHVSSKLFPRMKAKLASCHPGSHEAGHLVNEINMASIKEPLREIVVPYKGCPPSWLLMLVCRLKLSVTTTWRHYTVAQLLRSWWSFWRSPFVPVELSRKCIRYEVLEQALLLSTPHPLLLGGGGC